MKNYHIIFALALVLVLAGCGDAKKPSQGDQATTPLSSQEYGGVLRSSDGGKTFEPRSLTEDGKTLARTNILSLVVDPADNHTIYAGTQKSGIFVTHNSGESWRRLNFSPLYTAVIAVNPRHTQTLYVSAVWDKRGRLFRSDDGGDNWKDIYIEPIIGTSVTSVVLSPDDPQVIYIGTSGSDQTKATLARSVDGGASWENLYTASAAITHISIDAKNHDIIYAYSENNAIIRSKDRGATWEDVRTLNRENNEPYFTGSLYAFSVDPLRSGVLYVGTNEGLFRSEDYGLSWYSEEIIASSKGLPIRALALPPTGDGLLYVAGKAVYVRTSLNGSWAITDTRSDKDVVVVTYDTHDPRIIYMGLRIIKPSGLFGL